ncbi:MAG: L,D-transpeptidase family protein [Planctomycetota bacterium]
MKKFLLLCILAAGAWAGYRYWWLPRQELASEQADEQEAADQELADQLAAEPQLPAEAAAAREQADAIWQEMQAAEKDPTLQPEAPELARLYSQVLRATYNVPALKGLQLELIEQRLRPLSERLFFGRKVYRDDPTDFFVAHTIKPGERLDEIARHFGLSYQHINIMRGTDPESGAYQQGRTIKVYRGRDERFGGFLIHIDLGDFFMDVHLGGIFARRYPIGHGAVETPTPTGETRIVGRVRDPQWTDPVSGQVYMPGDPGNILGPVWLPFDDIMLNQSGLGIHGYTGDGAATGARVSNGCIRMDNEDAVEFYNLMVPTAGDPATEGFISRVPMRVHLVE